MNQPDHGSSYGSELVNHTKMDDGITARDKHASQNPYETEQDGGAQNGTVDAGLKSLDHCTFYLRHAPSKYDKTDGSRS